MRYIGSALGMTLAGLIFGAPIPFADWARWSIHAAASRHLNG